MDFTTKERSEVLIQALPYIQKYNDKIVVVKYGGNAMLNAELKHNVMSDLVLLSLVGIKVVLIHGGGPEITEMLEKVGKKSEFVDGLRVTDEESAQIVTMVLAGKINKELVGLVQNIGGRAIGLSGIDGHLIMAEKKDERLGFVGKITKINPQIIFDSLEMGYIPIISTIGYDLDANNYNINADTAAAEIAASLGAESLICMTDTPGILNDQNDPDSLIVKLNPDQARELTKNGIISGGMIPKVDCCIEAVEKGVKKVFIIDGRIPHSILVEIFTDKGLGTMFSE